MDFASIIMEITEKQCLFQHNYLVLVIVSTSDSFNHTFPPLRLKNATFFISHFRILPPPQSNLPFLTPERKQAVALECRASLSNGVINKEK